MKLMLVLLSLITAGCSTCNVTVTPPAGTGAISISINQGRKGLDSLLDGVQANVPFSGGTVSNPVNTTSKETAQ